MPGRNKTAIICMGGGMRSAHGAGFLYALGKNLGIVSPDILIGSSGNAGNALYYLAGQYDFLREIWHGVLSRPEFISFLRFYRVMNIDYLVDEIFKKELPLDVSAANHARTEYFIPITDFESGATRYVGKGEAADVFELLRAAKAIPLAFGKKVALFGRYFIDGELGATLSDHVSFALEQGATRILVVNNTLPYGSLGKVMAEVYAFRFSKGLRDAWIRDMAGHAACMTSKDATILCVYPEKLPVHVLTRDKKKLSAAFETGVNDALELEKELRALFNAYI